MADKKLETTARTAAHFGFAALLFALLGWMDLEIVMLNSHFSVRAQLLTCALGLCLTLSACRRYQAWWLPIARSTPQTTLQGHARARLVGHGVMLVAAGSALGYLMNTGFAFATMGAGLLSYVPWSRNKFCRDYFFLSHALLVAGALPLLLIAAGHQHPIMLIAHAWILWSLAAGLICLTLWFERSTALASTNSQASQTV